MVADVVLRTPTRAWTAADLAHDVGRVAHRLRQEGVQVLATLLDNGAAWVVADLAAERAGIVHVPLPGFFTAGQRAHALQHAGADALLLPAAASPGLPFETVGDTPLVLQRLPGGPRPYPAGTVKLTYTSGTTGTPKGVCLGRDALEAVARGIVEATATLGIERHLCALPLPVLLENVAGVRAPLARGATCIVPPLAEVGLRGSSEFDPSRLHRTVQVAEAQSLILLPQMLRAWTAWLVATGTAAPTSLKLVAVGGAAVGERLVAGARAVGLPAFEGYGLSEGASVQTLNLPGADRPGSAGRPLPHARVRVSAEGEIEVAGSGFLGYLGAPQDGPPPAPPPWWPTGDLGWVDDDGYVHVRGRRKLVLITGFGRNVSPEWVETALRAEPAIAQAVVLGDGEPTLSAVLWPTAPGASVDDAALQQAVDACNAALPDYARIGRWVRGQRPFTAESGLATANGRPQREAVLALHADALGLNTPTEARSAPDGIPMTTSFHARLVQSTAGERARLVSAPIIEAVLLRGEVSLPSYVAFLTEAFHHVRHTVPLLQACKARVPDRLAWLRDALDEYIEEEAGHDEWILDDLVACGEDREACRLGAPAHATEVMVAYAYDTIARRNPLGFLGMVHVLEGTSVALALQAADRIQRHLGLPDRAFSYLRSHGTLDREHTQHFQELVDRLDEPQDQADIVHAARAFYRLYGDVFRGLPMPLVQAAPATAAEPA